MRVCVLLVCFLVMLTGGASAGWRSLAPGLELGMFAAGHSSPVGDSQVTVLRIDPNLWELQFAGLSQTGETQGRTARQWCETHQFTAAINAGMFGTDFKTHLGYLEYRDHVNNVQVTGYQSVAAFDPVEGKNLPRYRIFDLDDPGVSMAAILRDYASVVQNLRLIKRPGLNRWSQQEKRWSEAVLGEDMQGRILFIFSRSPFTMHDLNRELLAMGIGVIAAQHLEGGPEAQLYLHLGAEEMEMFGSYETSFRENNDNATPWPIPNVLGIRRRSVAH